MKTNSKIRKESQKKASPANSDVNKVPHAGGREKKNIQPDYSSMHQAIEKVKDPVSFEEIKEFYGM